MEKTFFALAATALISLGFLPQKGHQGRPNIHRAQPSISRGVDTVPGQNATKPFTDAAPAPDQTDEQDKPYAIVDGHPVVRSLNGWASNGGSTDIIMVDGKPMTPAEVNRNIKRNEIQAVGALGADAAEQKYGVHQPVLEIYKKGAAHIIEDKHQRDLNDTYSETVNKEKDVNHTYFENETHVDDVYFENLEREKEAVAHQKMVQQHQQLLAMQQETTVRKQKEEELLHAAQLQKKEDMERQQQIMIEKERKLQEQQRKMVEQQRQIVKAVTAQLIKDGLIKAGDHFQLRLNSDGMYVNEVKQPAEVFDKYRKLIESLSHQPFGADSEWKINQ